MPELVFMYGLPASGKTTYAEHLQKTMPEKDYVRIAANEVRQELYGSADSFGNPEEIYGVLLRRILAHLKAGHNVIYDACNLYRKFRMDYLEPIEKAGINCYKTCVRMNAVKATCLENHAARNRGFDIDKIAHYFDICEPPSMEEGWDYIYNVQDMKLPGTRRFYIASPFFQEDQRNAAIMVAENLRKRGHAVFLPLEHKFENAWNMPNHVWGRNVFEYDLECIGLSDFVVCLSYGRMSSAGTNWEAGYAHGIGKPVLVVEMPGTKLMSLMLMNGCHAVFKSPEDLYAYDFVNAPVTMDKQMEQK